jgi:hypothetical protein
VKWGEKGPNWDMGAKLGVNAGLTWVQMPDKVWDRCSGTMRDMGDLFGMLEMGEIGGTGGKLGEGRDLGGLRVGSRTHFSVGHLGESCSLRRQVLEILVCLGWGTDDLGCLIGKWKSGFIRGLGMGGFGFVDRRVGVWI